MANPEKNNEPDLTLAKSYKGQDLQPDLNIQVNPRKK